MPGHDISTSQSQRATDIEVLTRPPGLVHCGLLCLARSAWLFHPFAGEIHKRLRTDALRPLW
jgi:hypothetical protein